MYLSRYDQWKTRSPDDDIEEPKFRCDDCGDTGWVPDDNDILVPCACHTGITADDLETTETTE